MRVDIILLTAGAFPAKLGSLMHPIVGREVRELARVNFFCVTVTIENYYGEKV